MSTSSQPIAPSQPGNRQQWGTSQTTFDTLFVHVEGHPEGGIRHPVTTDWIMEDQIYALDDTHLHEATAKHVHTAPAVSAALQDVLDTSEFGRAFQGPALKPPLDTPVVQALLKLAAG
jgi:hypothetical protein